MPFTTTPLADDDLDALLGGAAARLGGVTTGLSVGPAPAPASSVGTRLAAVAAVGLAAAGVAGVLAVSRGGDGAAPLPPGFAEGRYGTEVPIAEVDDGDGNPDTVLLRISPRTDVGTVTIRRNGAAADGATATTAVAAVVVGEPDSATPVPPPPSELCIESPGAGGACGTAAQFTEPQLHVGQRGSAGTALVTGVPDDVVAVAFDAGRERHWQRPVRGVALFPLDEDASPDAVVTFVRADGSRAARLTGNDGTLTDTEVAAQAVTTATGRDLPAVWLGSSTSDLPATFGTWLRRTGRATATGFAGPFAVQGFGEGGPDSDTRGVALVTVRTDDVDAARARLTPTTSGAIRRAIDNPDGTTVLVWARTGTPDDQVAAVVATLRAREPDAGTAIDLTRPWSWRGQRTGPYVATEVAATMFGVPVGTVEFGGRQRQVWATADDLGLVRFASLFAVADGTTLAGPTVSADGPFAVPVAGDPLVPGQLLAVPATTTALRLTFVDGTVVDAQLLDVRPVVNAKLAVVPAGGTVRSVEAS